MGPDAAGSHGGGGADDAVLPYVATPLEDTSLARLSQITATTETGLHIVILQGDPPQEYPLPSDDSLYWEIDRAHAWALSFLWGEGEAGRRAVLPYVFFGDLADHSQRQVQIQPQDREGDIWLHMQSRRGSTGWQVQEFRLDPAIGGWTATPETARSIPITEIIYNTADLNLTFDRLQDRRQNQEDHEPEMLTLLPGETHTAVDRELQQFFYTTPGMRGEYYIHDFYIQASYLQDGKGYNYPVRAQFSGDLETGYTLKISPAEDESQCRRYQFLFGANI